MSSKQKLYDVGSKDKLECVEIVESAGSYKQLLIARIIIGIESRQ